MTRQNVRLALGEMEEDAEYKSMMDSSLDPNFNALRQEVDMAGIRLFQLPPHEAPESELDGRLERMLAHCVGPLVRFKPFIENARLILHAT